MQEIFNLFNIRQAYISENKQVLVNKIDTLIELVIDDLMSKLHEPKPVVDNPIETAN